MIKRKDIFNTVADRLVQSMGVARWAIKEESTFADDLGMDSLDITEGLMELEEEFDIEVPDAVALEWRTVGDVVDYLSGRLVHA